MILLDSNVFIHLLKGDPNVTAWIQRQPRRELGVPAIVVYELEYGSLKSNFSTKRRTVLHRGMENIDQVPFDTAAALAAAQIRIKLESDGIVIGPLDLLIAGTAISRRASLATSNTKEFSRVKDLTLVSLSPGRGR